jgi:hypothetical protein
MEYFGYFLHQAENIIRALDTMDGDTDLEPTLGSVSVSPDSDQRGWSQGGDVDEREADGDDLEPEQGGSGVFQWSGMETDGLTRRFKG